MHLLVDAGGDGLPAAFGMSLSTSGTNSSISRPSMPPAGVDFLDGHLGAVQMVGVVGHAVGS